MLTFLALNPGGGEVLPFVLISLLLDSEGKSFSSLLFEFWKVDIGVFSLVLIDEETVF